MANLPPSITSTPVTAATETQTYQYDVEASDPNPGDSLNYSLTTAPVGMAIDAITGMITWVPSETDIGTTQVSVRVQDQAGAEATQTYTLAVAYFNDPPTITSMAITTANEGEGYLYDVEASDPDVGDNLSFSLVTVPQGMTINSVSGLIQWTPDNQQLGDNLIEVMVTDAGGLSDTQSFTIVVVVLNAAPMITSAPLITATEQTAYHYDVEAVDADGDPISYALLSAPAGMTIDPQTGVISWLPGTAQSLGNLAQNNYCRLPATSGQQRPRAMDAVMVVDGSGSNQDAWPWIADAMASLNADLKLIGIGADPEENRFGLVGFGTTPAARLLNGNHFGSIADLFEATYDGISPGGSGTAENGLRALQFTIDTYQFRDDVVKNLIWIPDEPQQGTLQNNETLEVFTQRLIDENFSVNVITPLSIDCLDGRRALGIDADGQGYVTDGGDGFEYCEIDRTPIDQGSGGYYTSYIEAYVLPALASGGAAWNLTALRTLNQEESLRKALTSRMYRTSAVNEAERGLADLAVHHIELIESVSATVNVNVSLINRGRALVDTPVSVALLDAGNANTIVATQTLTNLAADEEHLVEFVIDEASVPTSIRVRIDTESGVECLIDNNLIEVPSVLVEASDNQGNSDSQLFAISVQDVNQSPVISSSPELLAYVGQPYIYQITFDDPDIGDDHQFTLTSNTLATVDQDTGLLTYTPTVDDLGEKNFTVTVTDLGLASDTQTFNLNVSGDYLIPRFDGPPSSSRTTVNQPYQFTPSVTADPTAVLSFSLMEMPTGMTIDSSDGSIQWVPSDSDLNRLRLVTMVVTDQFNNRDSLSFMLFGDTENQSPVITTTPNETARLRTTYSYAIQYEDPNVREDFDLLLATTAPNLAANISQSYGLDNLNGTISWIRGAVTSTYPRHLINSDFLCLDPNLDHPSTALPHRNRWSAGATFIGRDILAVPLVDTNEDGVINSLDRSAILMTYAAGITTFLRAYDSTSGQPIWTHEFNGYDVRTSQLHTPAVADINTDGVPDIIMVEDRSRLLVAISSDDRRVLWKSTVAISDYGFSSGQITLTDLENDGAPEILAGFSIYDAQGNWIRSLQRPVNVSSSGFISPIYPVDLDLDGNKELIQGGIAYSTVGTELWRVPFSDNHGSRLAYSAFANFDADSEPEIVHVERSDTDVTVAKVSLLDSDGSFIWGPNDLQYVGQPIVGDLDGDGELEIFISGEDVLLDHMGNEQWRLSGFSRQDRYIATAADLQGNGRVEIVLNRNGHTRVIDALTGGEITGLYSNNPRGYTKPVVVDLDGDGKLEVVNASNRSINLSALEFDHQRSDIPTVANQILWQPNGLNDQLAVNQNAPMPWSLNNSDQVIMPAQVSFNHGLPDIWVDAPQGNHRQAVNVQVANRGTADYAGLLDVELYAGDPLNGGQLLGSQTLSGLAISEAQIVQFNNLVPTDFVGELVARAAPEANLLECQTNNNMTSAYTVDLSLSDHEGATATQNYLLGVEYNYTLNAIATQTLPDVVEGELFEHDLDIFISNHTDDNNSLFFHVYSGPEGLTVNPDTGVVQWTPPYGAAGIHTATIYGDHLTGLSSRYLRINVLPASNYPPEITSTPQTGSFAFQPFSYDVEASDPDGDTLTYSLTQSPTGMTIDATSGLIQWTPDANGTFPVTVVVSDGAHEATQDFTLIIVVPNSSPEITSTPSTSVLLGQPYQYQMTATDPEGDTITFALVTNPVGMQINQTTGLVSWTPGTDQVGVHSVELTATDSQGNISTQSYLLSVNTGAGNTPPTIVSTPAGNAIYDQAYGYDVNATDSDGDTLTYLLVTAPSGMVIDSVTGMISWIPQTSQGGAHPIEIRVEDGQGGYAIQRYGLYTSDGTTTNALPEIQSQPGLNARINQAYSYQVVATDADGDTLSYSLINGPAGLSLSNSGLVTWTPDAEQSASVRVRVSDGTAYVEQGWTINVLPAGANLAVALSIQPATVAEGDTVTLQVIPQNAIDPFSVSLTVDGSPVTLDNTNSALVTATGLGSHPVVATVTDPSGTVTENGSFLVSDPNSTTPPVVTLVGPIDGSEITAPTPIVATITDDDLSVWELWLVPPGQNTVNLDQATLLASGIDTLDSQEIAQFDPTLLINGQHRLYLRAIDAGGNEGYASSVVQVTGDMKLGHFSITFKDLEVPLAGIPITVTRTYDSRRRNESLDFGQGWSVGYQDMFVRESRPAGFNWFLDSYQSGPLGILTTYCVRPYQDNIVTVTNPDGDVERFRAVASPECNEVLPILDVEIVFEPLDGTDSTLEALNNSFGRLVNQHLVDAGAPSTPLDISRYRLTTREGVSYELEQGEGIRTLTVPSGEILTFGYDGITHSSGAAVSFVRDASGRIEQIEAPDGENLQYAYDLSNDLVSFTDQAAAASTYAYINDHYLQDIYDARGVRAIRNLYNSEGRLIGQIDAEGNQIDYVHDLVGRSQTVTDRRGNSRILVFNDRGDIVAETNALGETHQRSYDSYGNELSHTDPLGNTTVSTYDNHGNQLTETDPLSRVTTNTYSWYNQLQNETAPDGRVTSFDYRNYIFVGGVRIDKKGPMVGITDGLNQNTQLGYDASGYLPLQLTDAEGNITRYAYDSQGRMVSETAADGSVTEYSHDTMGRVLTETRSRTDNGTTLTEVTRHGYDAAGRRTSTTDPLGNITRTEYDEAGQVTAEIDALGNRTEYVYDARGNQTETRYPDGTTETRSYDPENNLIAQTDRAGQTTQMVYDAANRLIETLHPDTTPTDDSDNPRSQNEYDAGGRLIAETDALGNRTQHSYNVVGQRISTTDAQNNVTQFEYDVHGNRTAMIDALNRRTEYIYDAADQLVEVRYADTSTTQTAFDAVGRRVSETDQAIVSTQYAYDEQGRLTQVIDTLGGTTSYSYDEQGNKLTQTDADNRTTRWAYDSLGRVLSRTLPMGQSETFAYDVNGNLTSHIDFNGQTTTHQYDSDNRLIQSDYADGTVEVIGYDANGNRSQVDVTRPGGTQETSLYSYDPNSRLETEVQPDGTVLTYQYDAASNRTQVHISLPDGSSKTTDYSYDSLNRLQSVTDAAGTTSYGYDAVGNRTSVSYPNGSSEVYQYNNLNRLTRKETYNGAGTLVQAYDYTLHVTGRRSQIDEQNGRSTSYSYDDLYRLTGETITDSQNGNYSASYQYDGVGNRTYSTIDGVQTAYTYDDNDRLIQQGGTSYTYDESGNTLTEIIDTNTITYGYNAKNELVSVEQGGNTTEYAYNPNGIRTSKSEGGTTTSYIVDENRDYAQVLIEDDGTAQVSYTYGDDLISQDRGGVTSFYHYDGLGSTRSLTDSQGNLANTYDYEAFGEVLGQTGSVENGYLFAGEQFDSTLDQYYLRARYYDPSQGRFTQQDTWMGHNHDPVTLHKYLYANADPANNIDPTGNFSLGSLGTAINVAGTLASVASTTYDVFQVATGEEEFSAKDIGINILLSRLPVKTVKKILSRICPGNSFEGQTLVTTEEGLVAIKDVKIGDKVWAYNDETGEKSIQEVVHLIEGEGEKNLVDITLKNGEVIHATEGHPFYLPELGGKWLKAKDLKKGHQLLGLNNELFVITNLERYKKDVKVYNLTIANDHTYYVGDNQVLSHNAQKVCPIKGLVFGAKKPLFQPNVKHTVGGAGKRPGLPAGIEPDDSYYAFQKLAVKSAVNGRWYAKSSDGKSIYRYFESNGVAHWSGSTGDKAAKLRLDDIPIEVRRAFGIVK
ncbi:MAG: putative Ig domain-containing protein [Candidatus Thiodiazotropha sp. LLP2]